MSILMTYHTPLAHFFEPTDGSKVVCIVRVCKAWNNLIAELPTWIIYLVSLDAAVKSEFSEVKLLRRKNKQFQKM